VSNANKTISLSQTLAYPHVGTSYNYTRNTDGKVWTADLRAEVGLLSHNIKIEGDLDSNNNSFGGHIMIHTGGKGYVSNVELNRMGQKTKNGRYPFHWHMLATTGAGQYIKNSSVHHSFNRAVTIHGTHGTTVENNFCYDHIGHGIFLENGSEINNLIKGNVVLLTKRPAPGEQLTPSDNQFDVGQNRTPSSYWVTNPNNTFINNVAAGTQGTGFWYALAQNFMFESATDTRFVGQKLPYNEVLGGFTGNKAHSCMNGLDILDRLDANHSILGNEDWIENSLKYFTNNTWYANDQGIYSGSGFNNREYTSKIIFKDNIFVENKIATMLASYNIIDESVYVANSGQNLVSGERYLHRVYDGPGTVKNSHFVGWTASNSNFLLNTGAAFKMANATFENITSDSSLPIRLSYPDFSDTFFGKNYFSGDNAPLNWCTVLFDKTGSITGLPSSSIVSNHPMLLVGDEATLPSWTNMYYTPRHYIHSGHSFSMGSNLPKFTVTRSKTNLPDVSFYDVFDDFARHQMSLIVNDDFLYTYQLESLPSTKAVLQDVRDATIGDQYISRYKDFGKLGGLLVRNSNYVAIPSYTSLAALKGATTTGCYIEPQGDLYLKTVATKKDEFYLIHWTTDFAVTPLDTDGDGYTDSNEASSSRNPNSASDLNFNFSTTADNWTSAGTIASTCVGCNSSFTINSNGSDAQIIRNDLNFDANKVQTLFADLKAQVNGNFKLYWTTQDEPFYSEDKSIIQNYNNAGLRKTISFNVSTNSKWINNKIKSLRLNMINAEGTTNLYSIYGDISKDDDGDGMPNYDEALACRDPLNAADFGLNFDTPNEYNNWNAYEVLNFATNNGIVSGSVSSGNIVRYNFLNLNGTSVPKFKLRIKASRASYVRIFWENEDGGFSESRVSTANYTSTTGQWQELTFDVSNNTNWIGKTIKSLRIDPVSGSNFEIDWLRSINYTDCSLLDSDSDGMSNYDETQACRDPLNGADFSLNFDTPNEYSNWNAYGIINFSTNNGFVSGNISSSGSIYRYNFLNLNGTSVPKFKLRIKASRASYVRIFWENEDGGFSESRVSTANYTSTTEQWQELTFDVSNNTNWIGKTIKSLRIDPVSGSNFEIDWLRSINYKDCSLVDSDSDGYSNANETLTCRDPQNGADFGLNFDTPYESFSNWSSFNTLNFSQNNGILSGKSSSNDPGFTQYNFLNLNGTLIPKIKIRIKVSAATTVQIFWENEDGGFSDNRSTSKNINSDIGQWQELIFDVSSNTNWIGKTIKSLRIDPVSGTNIDFEIDWLRSINYSDCSSCQTAYTAVALKTDSNWTYYGRAGSTDYLFAMEHKPSGGNTSTFTATINLTKLCDITNNVYNVSNTTTKEGIFIAGYYWNISTVGTLNGFVNMRFFPDTALNAALDAKSNTFYNIATSTQQSQSVYFKKTYSQLNLPNDIRTDAKGLNYGFSPLSVNAIGTYASKDYVQFNQVTNINNSGGGLLKKVTKLNENTFSEKGILRYNATADKFEGFNGIEWTPLH
jgi:hypothetical protein